MSRILIFNEPTSSRRPQVSRGKSRAGERGRFQLCSSYFPSCPTFSRRMNLACKGTPLTVGSSCQRKLVRGCSQTSPHRQSWARHFSDSHGKGGRYCNKFEKMWDIRASFRKSGWAGRESRLWKSQQINSGRSGVFLTKFVKTYSRVIVGEGAPFFHDKH